jgi:hypothetical protein
MHQTFPRFHYSNFVKFRNSVLLKGVKSACFVVDSKFEVPFFKLLNTESLPLSDRRNFTSLPVSVFSRAAS